MSIISRSFLCHPVCKVGAAAPDDHSKEEGCDGPDGEKGERGGKHDEFWCSVPCAIAAVVGGGAPLPGGANSSLLKGVVSLRSSGSAPNPVVSTPTASLRFAPPSFAVNFSSLLLSSGPASPCCWSCGPPGACPRDSTLTFFSFYFFGALCLSPFSPDFG